MSGRAAPHDGLRVLFVHRWGAIMAGGELWLLNLIAQLERRGVPSEVALHIRGPLHAALREAGVPVSLLPLDFLQASPPAALLTSGAGLLRSAAGLARLARASGARVVHAFSPEAAEVALPAARLARLPAVVTVHNGGPYPRFDRFTLARCDRAIAISRAVEGDLARAGVPAERIARIPSGVDFERLGPPSPGRLRGELGLPPGAPLIGMVATLEPKKAHDVLLRAMPPVLAAFPGAHLALIGGDHDGAPGRPGPHERRLRALAEGLGVAGRTHFLGFRADAAALLADLDLSVLCSRREALGLVAVESLAMGVPLVATAVEGLREVVEDGVSGLLVPPDDPQALAAAIVRLLGDRGLGARLAAVGRESVRRRFDAGLLALEHAALYASLSPGAAGAPGRRRAA